jgi:hypothetical protein
MKKALLIIISIMLFFPLSCEKKEEQSVSETTKPKSPIIDRPAAGMGHGVTVPKTELKIVVPPDVKDTWTAVVLIVEDKQENTKNEYTVNIGGELAIPGSDLIVKVGPFLPDFKMNADTITSASKDPNNPAVGIAIMQNEKKIFPASGEWGWLYAKFPTIHSFQHDRYGLKLKEGLKEAAEKTPQ